MIRGTGTGEQPGLVPAGLLLRTAAVTRKDPKTTAWRLFEASLSKGRSTEAGSKKGTTDQATFPNTDRSTLEAVTWIGGPTKGAKRRSSTGRCRARASHDLWVSLESCREGA